MMAELDQLGRVDPDNSRRHAWADGFGCQDLPTSDGLRQLQHSKTLRPSCNGYQHGHGVEDLIELDHWDTEKIVENFRVRFFSGKPYTGAGGLLVALNPCRDLGDVYGRDMQFKYLRYNGTDLPAHAYAMSAATYWALCEGRGCQTIFVGGESGAGKSFTASLVLEYLVAAASMSRSVQHGDQRWATSSSSGQGQGREREEGEGVDQTARLRALLESRNIVLKSFGNAGTPLNRDSSRMMTHTKVFFSNDASHVLGTETNTLLLETSRLARRSPGETTFHAFYQLLNADETVKRRLCLGDKTTADFRITAETQQRRQSNNNGTTPGDLSSINNRADDGGRLSSARLLGRGEPCGVGTLQKMLDALAVMGVTDAVKDELLRGLSAVLHIGEVEFKQVCGEGVHRDFGVVEVVDEAPLEAASEMLGCNRHTLRNALLTRGITEGGTREHASVRESSNTMGHGDVLTVPLDGSQARRARDSLAREIYLRLFRWLVKRVNICTASLSPQGELEHPMLIGLLDMHGFENVETSGFEHLCRNYAIETMRSKFLEDEVVRGITVFDAAGRAYLRTGQGRREHAWMRDAAVQAEENRLLLVAFEEPLGLIRLANDEGLCPEGSSRAFTQKLLGEVQAEFTEGTSVVNHRSRLEGGGRSRQHPREMESSTWPVYADSVCTDRSNPGFFIRHFVGSVKYTAVDLLEKNEGGIGQNLSDLLDEGCANELVGAGSRGDRYRKGRGIGGAADSSTVDHRQQNVYRRRLRETVLSQHQRQLKGLLREVGGSQVRYIFCVKPNEQLSPGALDGPGLLRQLDTAGVSVAARVRSLSLPSGGRANKEAFFKDFRTIPGVLQRILTNEGDCCKLGHDTIFFREGVWEALTARLEVIKQRSCVVIQRAWRAHMRTAAYSAEQAAIAAEAQRKHELREMRALEQSRQECERFRRAQAARMAEEVRLRREQQKTSTRQDEEALQEAAPCSQFNFSCANAVREARRAQETQDAQKNSMWGNWQLDPENGAVMIPTGTPVATEEARIAAVQTKRRLSVVPRSPPDPYPPPIAEAWLVEAQEIEARRSTTTPPISPQRASRHSLSSTASQGCVGEVFGARREARVVPRLGGLADYAMRAFLTEPVPGKYGIIKCRVTRRRDGGWKQLAPAYHMHHIEGGLEFMMSGRRQPLSRAANFYISTSPSLDITKDTRSYMGKLRAHDGGGSSYTLYDDGISPGRASSDRRQGLFKRKELAGVVFAPTRDEADGPRSMKASVIVEGCWSADVGVGGRANAGCVRERRRLPESVLRLRDRKPRYDHSVGAYVLDFPDHMSKLSIKNVQLELAEGSVLPWSRQRDRHHRSDDADPYVASNNITGRLPRRRRWESGTGTEGPGAEVEDPLVLLSLGKTAGDEFGLHFRGPLSPLQAFGMALAALDTKI